MRTSLPPLLAAFLALGLFAAPLTAADDPAVPPAEMARKKNIKGLKSKLRKLARSPHALKHRDDIYIFLDSLKALGGREAGEAALEAVPQTDKEIRDRAFDIVESNHHPKLVAPLAALLGNKAYRRDDDLQQRIAHALAVMADAKAIEPLVALIRTDITAEVVDEAARALATYAAQPVDKKRECVRRLLGLYATTYNLMMSMRPEDKIQKKVMAERYQIYGKTARNALQALTGQQLSRPQEWREWWNENKKAKTWKPGSARGSR